MIYGTFWNVLHTILKVFSLALVTQMFFISFWTCTHMEQATTQIFNTYNVKIWVDSCDTTGNACYLLPFNCITYIILGAHFLL